MEENSVSAKILLQTNLILDGESYELAVISRVPTLYFIIFHRK